MNTKIEKTLISLNSIIRDGGSIEAESEEMNNIIVTSLTADTDNPDIICLTPYSEKPETFTLYELYTIMVGKGSIDLVLLESGNLGIMDDLGNVAEILGKVEDFDEKTLKEWFPEQW